MSESLQYIVYTKKYARIKLVVRKYWFSYFIWYLILLLHEAPIGNVLSLPFSLYSVIEILDMSFAFIKSKFD